MRTTNRGVYALKAILALAAGSSRENPLALHVIARKEKISAEFLQQIFFRLRKAGIVAACRGPGGGFYLLKASGEISILDVLEAAGESMEIAPCGRRKADGKQFCQDFEGCSAGQFWVSLGKEIRGFAAARTLADYL